MITVNLKEVKEKFEDIIKEKDSRENVSNWAIKMQRAEDDRMLKYSPESREEEIWNGISYLTGVDLPDLNRKYLHSKEDFIEAKNKIFGHENQS